MEVISEDGDDFFQEDDAEEPQTPMSPVTPRLPAWLKKHRMSNYGEALRNFGVQSVVSHECACVVLIFSTGRHRVPHR